MAVRELVEPSNQLIHGSKGVPAVVLIVEDRLDRFGAGIIVTRADLLPWNISQLENKICIPIYPCPPNHYVFG